MCDELNLKSMQDIADLSDEKIDALNITPVQKKSLKALRDACAQGDSDLTRTIHNRKYFNREEAAERIRKWDERINEVEDYGSTLYLTRHDWDLDLARRISDDLEIQDEDDILLLPKSIIYRIRYLSLEQKEKLWTLICDAWRELSVEKRTLPKLKEELDKRDDELRKLKEKLDERDDDVQRERRELSRNILKVDEISWELEIINLELQNTNIELQEEKKKNQELNALLLKQSQRPDATRRAHLQGLLLELKSTSDDMV
jgi:hypothetical protein